MKPVRVDLLTTGVIERKRKGEVGGGGKRDIANTREEKSPKR